MLTAAQFQQQVMDQVIECFGSLEAFAEAYNARLAWEDEQEAIDMEGQ